MREIKAELDNIWKKEETAMWQRSRDGKILKGDTDTTYFHVVANQHKRKKNHPSVLEGPDGPIHSMNEMLGVASTFYKMLFGYDINLIYTLMIIVGQQKRKSRMKRMRS